MREHVEVFLSYARGDGATAAAIQSALAQAGVRVWWDAEILPGVAWDRSIEQHLKGAEKVLVLWSKRSIESQFVLAEAEFARANGRYIGILLDDAELPIPFDVLHHLRISSHREEGWVGPLLDLLRSQGIGGGARPGSWSQPSAGPAPKSNRGYAFVSHVEEDLPALGEISGFLKGRGYAYWSYHDSDRDYQLTTLTEIEQRLNDSALMLTVLSPEWKRSDWTMRELAFAREIRKPLFLLRFRHPGPTLAIAGDTYIDFERDKADGFRRLGTELDKRGL